MKERLIALVFCVILAASPIWSEVIPQEKDAADADSCVGDHAVTTEHQTVIAGKKIKYTATAGTMMLDQEGDGPRARIFYIAYTKKDVRKELPRPVTFSFNGGPGSSSVWLHLGFAGPKRVLMKDDGSPLPPPYRLVDNDYSLLDETDLVFIDPVTTGFSRSVPEEKAGHFHGLEEDIRCVGDFIRLYTARSGRWGSPKILMGESYGTTRAAGLSEYLYSRYGMTLNGVILVSSILDFQTTDFDPGNDYPAVLYLPSYTATAWYHGRLDEELQADLKKALAESEEFALGEYSRALLLGDRLDEKTRSEVAVKLARLTGLSERYVRQSNLRIRIYRFVKELLRSEMRTAGRLDSRFKGKDRDSAGESYEYDPSYAAIYGPFSTLLNDYVRNELGYENDLPYEILTGRVHPWNYGKNRSGYVNVSMRLRDAMTENPDLKVFVANGYYDLATPYFATAYTFSHMNLDESIRGNVTMGFYEAGHMMYIHRESLVKLRKDLSEFYDSLIPDGRDE